MADKKLFVELTAGIGTLTQDINKAVGEINKGSERASKSVTAAIARIRKVYREELAALKDGSKERQEYWRKERDNANNTIAALRGRKDLTEAATRALKDQTQEANKFNEAQAKIEKQQRASKMQPLIEKLQDAFTRLTTAQSKYLTALKQGDASSQSYWQHEIELAQRAIKTNKERAADVDKTVESRKKYEQVLMNINKAEERYKLTLEATNATLQNRGIDQKLNEAKAAYTRLTQAQSKYLQAVKEGNKEGEAYWNSEATKAKTSLEAITKEAEALGLSATQKEKLAQQNGDAEAAAQRTLNTEQKLRDETEKNAKSLQNMVGQIERWVATMVLLRGVRSLWNKMTEYAETYYDKMNEIRVVTGKTEEDAEALGERYRDLAREMMVSSTSIAEAAVTYFRQGLEDEDVEERLRYTTMYAKVAGVEFSEAAELMTAAMNGMGLSADHVADVWLYLGDSAGTSGKEIGLAMQKTAASADMVGLSFEKLGAYIATMSEKTRQAPQVIGTALASMFARLQQIKEKGFNEEDETRINDIAKALDTVGLSLMDDNGEWVAFDAILEGLAEKWTTLTDKEQAYIATTLGGTRQRNYLLTLLNDLSEATGEQSRAMELYNGAMQAAGVTMEKYAVWQESVAAAQGALTAELERFYSILSANTIKGFLNVLTNIMKHINNVTEATNGWNIKIGLAVGLLGALAQAIVGVATKTGALTIASGGLSTAFGQMTGTATSAAGSISLLNIALTATVAGAIVAGIVGLVGLLGNLGKASESAAKNTGELADLLGQRVKTSTEINDYIAQQSDMSQAATNTTEDIDKFNAIRSEIVSAFPELEEVLQGEVSDVSELDSAYRSLIETLVAYRSEKFTSNWADAYQHRNDAAVEYDDAYNALFGRNGYSDGLFGYGSAYFRSALEKVNGGGILNADVASLLSGQEFSVASMRAYMDIAQKNIELARSEKGDVWDRQIRGTSENVTADKARADYLDNVIIQWDTLFGEYDKLVRSQVPQLEKKLADTVQVAVTSAVDPKAFEGFEAYGFQLTDAIFKAVYQRANSELGDMDILSLAEEYATNVIDTLNLAAAQTEGLVSSYSNNPEELAPQKDQLIQQIMNIFTLTDDVVIPPSLIRDMLRPLGEALSVNIDDYVPEEIYEPIEESVDSAINSALEEALADAADKYKNAGRFIPDSWRAPTLGYTAGSRVTDLISKGATGAQLNDIFGGFISRITPDEAWIAEFEKAGTSYADFLRQMNEAEAQPIADALPEAEALLARIESVEKLIDSVEKNGQGDSSVLKDLGDVFGEDLTSIFADAITEDGLFDPEQLIEALRNALADMKTEAGENPLLAALGFDEESAGITADTINSAIESLAEATDIDAFKKIWDGLSQDVQDSIAETYPEIAALIQEVEADVDESAGNIESTLERIRKAMDLSKMQNNGTVWEDMSTVLSDIEGGGSKASKAIANVQGRIDDAKAAMGAMEAAANGDADAIDYLAKLTGLTADSLANDLTPAEYAVAEASAQAGNSAAYLANMLYAAGAVQIDPSGKLIAIGSIQNAAAAAGMTVAEFAAILTSLNGASFKLEPLPDGSGAVVNAKVAPVKWTGAATTSGRSSGGGGGSRGGGGGGSMSVSKAVSNMLDSIANLKTYKDYRRELAQLAQEYYQTTGELQGVILYLGIERDIVEENMEALKGYLGQIEKEMEAKKATMASTKEGSAAYKQAELDLNELQEKHQEYSKELIQNKTDVVNLTNAIKEQNDTIRQMEIDLRNTVLSAIEDREAAEERMLDGRIATENEILGLIKRRYERERDEILETQKTKKSALQEELQQIDELLAARKKLAEEEDKMQRVAELEEKIARISADPTRQKEAMKLREDLADLREEIAWDAAEKEAEAQKDSIEQQITSIDEYVEYVQNYYEDLFKHPQKLIEEMRTIITGTDEEIIAWLKANSEDYAEATEATQTKMVNDWQSMLDDMNDAIRTYWEEVETIVQSGSDNIIDFLMKHSQSYREAGKLQAEAYVDEWRKQLDDLEAAYRKVNGGIQSYNYTTTSTSTSGGGGGGGSGSGSGSGGGGNATGTSTTLTAQQKALNNRYQYEYRDTQGNWVLAPSAVTDERALLAAKTRALAYWQNETDMSNKAALTKIPRATTDNPGFYFRKVDVKRFSLGGMNTTTGLAFLDGTMSRPERILSAYQTELFEDMLQTLHAIRTVRISPMSGAPSWSGAGALPNIDNVTVNVANLDSATDIADAAEKLMNEFYKKISRARPVGGIQGW